MFIMFLAARGQFCVYFEMLRFFLKQSSAKPAPLVRASTSHTAELPSSVAGAMSSVVVVVAVLSVSGANTAEI